MDYTPRINKLYDRVYALIPSDLKDRYEGKEFCMGDDITLQLTDVVIMLGMIFEDDSRLYKLTDDDTADFDTITTVLYGMCLNAAFTGQYTSSTPQILNNLDDLQTSPEKFMGWNGPKAAISILSNSDYLGHPQWPNYWLDKEDHHGTLLHILA